MTDREHARAPYRVQVEFRTASSFLVAYSVNLSRGGLFLETEEDIPTGSVIGLELQVPGAEPLELIGITAWRRAPESPDGAAGLGIEFQDVAPQLGSAIDRLVTAFHGVHILLLSGDRHDRTAIARLIKSIISTAEIVQAADITVAGTLMTGELDLAVIDVDYDPEGGLGIIRAAKQATPPVPIIALTGNPKTREAARAAGADEIAANPPPFDELQLMLVRALSRPVSVRNAPAA